MANVVIVGAGVIGLFCALRLAQAGQRVTVLEGEAEDFTPYAPTASLAAAGMLAPISESSDAAHPGFAALAAESFDLWRRLAKGALWEDGLSFNGAALVHARADPARLGGKASALSPAAFRKLTGLEPQSDDLILIEDEGVADPVRVLSGLCMDARRHGVIVQYGTDIDAVAPDHVLTTTGDRIEADRVVLATGAWMTEAMRAGVPALSAITPAKGQLVPVALKRPLGVNVHAPDFYLAPRLDDVVLGASQEMGVRDRQPDPIRAAALVEAADRAFPGQIAPAGRGWAGVRPMSPDGAPLVGESGGVLVACGHSRNGWLLAPVTGEIITAYVEGAELSPLWASFSPARFETGHFEKAQ